MKKLLTLFLVVFAFAACAKESNNVPPAAAPEAAAAQAQQAALAAPVYPALSEAEQITLTADYNFPALNGGSDFVLSRSSNKPVLVAIMAGYCGFCKRMIPYIDELAGRYKDKNVDVIIAFVDQNPQGNNLTEIEAVKAIQNVPVYYNSVPLKDELKLEGYPTMYLINNGKLIQKWIGADPSYVDFMAQEINKVL